MNGFVKKDSEKVYGFNSTKNIEHKGFNLFDYLETLKVNLLNIFNIGQATIVGVGFNDYSVKQAKTYEDIDYSNISYNRYTNSNDFELNANGIYVKSQYKKNLVINLSTNVRADSGKAGYRYCKVELWRNDSMVSSEFSAVYLDNGNGRQNISIPTFFKCTYNDCIKIKVYGETNDVFLLTRANISLYKNNDNTYYEGI